MWYTWTNGAIPRFCQFFAAFRKISSVFRNLVEEIVINRYVAPRKLYIRRNVNRQQGL